MGRKTKQIKRSWTMTGVCAVIAAVTGFGIYSVLTSSLGYGIASYYGIMTLFVFACIFATAIAGIYYGSKARIYQEFSWIADQFTF